MKSITTLMIIAFMMVSTQAWAQTKAGLIKTVSGNVQIQRGGTQLEAGKGQELLSSDVLITNQHSYAGIIFTDGTTFTIGPDTEFIINDYQYEPEVENYAFSMHLKKGSAVYNSGKIGKLSPESVDLTTPRATVGIRGTRFIINVE